MKPFLILLGDLLPPLCHTRSNCPWVLMELTFLDRAAIVDSPLEGNSLRPFLRGSRENPGGFPSHSFLPITFQYFLTLGVTAWCYLFLNPRGQAQDLEHRCALKYCWLFECRHEQMSIFSRISGWNKHIVEIYFGANVSFEPQMGHDDCLIYLSKDKVGSGVSHRPNFVVKHPNEASNT